MSEILDVLYKLITNEQMTGYKDSSALGGFDHVVSEWCDRELASNDDAQASQILKDIISASQNYGTGSIEMRERKIAEIGRMLLNLRDVLQQRSAKASQVQFNRSDFREKVLMYKQEGRLTEAIIELDKLLESKSDNVFALSHLAHIYILQNKPEESVRLIDRALKLDPSNAFANKIKGDILFIEGNMNESATIFEGLINLKPDDTYAYSKLGVIYRKQGRLEDALSVLKRGIEIAPDDPSLHRALGDVHSQSGNDEEAVVEYQKAVEIDPEDEYAFKGIVSSKSKEKDINTAISQLQKVLKIPSHSQNPHLHALLGTYLKQQKQYDTALLEFREALKLNPNSIYFQTQLAFCYSKLEQYQRVIELLEPINRIRSRDPLIVQALAKAYSSIGRFEDARRILIDILYVYPNDHSLRSALMKVGRSKPISFPRVTEEQKTGIDDGEKREQSKREQSI
jgi:tetratricopeptide (TPR) repeat protein